MPKLLSFFSALLFSLAVTFANVVLAQSAVNINVEIKDQKVVGQKTFRVKQGDDVTLTLKTDQKVELHLHGYDIEKTVTPGKVGVLKFTAKATGRFPVTAHGFGEKKGHGHGSIMFIEVHPR